MNLDMMYEVSRLTGDPKYANVATHQAEKSMTTHVRKDGTTYHVVNFDQKTGEAIEFMTAQGECASEASDQTLARPTLLLAL